MEIKIIPASPEDIDACYRLSQNNEELAITPGVYPSKEELTAGLESGILLVAKDDNDVAGYALGYQLSNYMAYLDLLVVDIRYRGKGIGSRLIEAFQKTMEEKGVKQMFLITNPECKVNEAFYLKNKFSKGKEFRLYWKEL